MHLVLSGPYEILYTTGVDIWSFGCLLLTIFIGKSGPLKQRGVCYASSTLTRQVVNYYAVVYSSNNHVIYIIIDVIRTLTLNVLLEYILCLIRGPNLILNFDVSSKLHKCN